MNNEDAARREILEGQAANDAKHTCIVRAPGKPDEAHDECFILIVAKAIEPPGAYQMGVYLQFRAEVLPHLLNALGEEIRFLGQSDPLVTALALHEFAAGLRGSGGLCQRGPHTSAEGYDGIDLS